MKIYVAAAVEALRKKERHGETQFSTKIGGKTSLGPSYFLFCKISILSYAFRALIYKNRPISPLNRLTLWITPFYFFF